MKIKKSLHYLYQVVLSLQKVTFRDNQANGLCMKFGSDIETVSSAINN